MNYLCIHGHFYQPPRENPWLEAIELQESAHPYHDWNERIHAECYAPNSTARILDDREAHRQHREQLCQDQLQFWAHFALLDGGQGSGRLSRHSRGRRGQRIRPLAGMVQRFAQPYNHMIMPLANRRDKYHPGVLGNSRLRASLWPPAGRHVAARSRRGPRHPGGPDGASGIKFTVLAPHQAHRVRS